MGDKGLGCSVSSELAALDNIYQKTYFHISGTDGRIPGHQHCQLPLFVCVCVSACPNCVHTLPDWRDLSI